MSDLNPAYREYRGRGASALTRGVHRIGRL